MFLFGINDSLVAQIIGALLVVYTIIFGSWVFSIDKNIYDAILKIWYFSLLIPLTLSFITYIQYGFDGRQVSSSYISEFYSILIGSFFILFLIIY